MDVIDARIRVPLNGKVVDLGVLDADLGGHGLAADETEVVIPVDSPVTAEQVAAAIDAHILPPPPLTVAEKVEALPDPSQDLAGFKAGLVGLFS